MKFIKYEFDNGETKVIPVTTELSEASKEINRQIYNNNQKNTRRHNSIDVLTEHDLEPSYEPDLLRMAEIEKLKQAMEQLSPQQHDLVYRVYFHEEKQNKIAQQLGITPQSVNDQLKVIYKSLKQLIQKS